MTEKKSTFDVEYRLKDGGYVMTSMRAYTITELIKDLIEKEATADSIKKAAICPIFY